MKFGGSSVADAERIRTVARIVEGELAHRPLVVLSAMGDSTDDLIAAGRAAQEGGARFEGAIERLRGALLEIARELGLEGAIPGADGIDALFDELTQLLRGVARGDELSAALHDRLLSFGERLSVRFVARYFTSIGLRGQAMDAWDAGFVSDENAGRAEPLDESGVNLAARLPPLVDAGIVPIITGFIAKNRAGEITTLGRGGSDLTATYLAAALRAEEVQIWKDVDGIMTYDPRVIAAARPVAELSYEEAAELAYFGAQVLHPRAMLPCGRTGTPVRIKNTYNPAVPGTRIVARLSSRAAPVRALTSRSGVTLIDIVSARMLGQSGFLGEVFSAFARHKISVDMVATSEVSISVTLDSGHDLPALVAELSRIAHIEIKSGKAIITIICDVRKTTRILERAFAVAGARAAAVEMISQGASKVNISFVINEGGADELVRALHFEFFEKDAPKEPSKEEPDVR
jgi:aspartate kinase